jgi:hypothetical protein
MRETDCNVRRQRWDGERIVGVFVRWTGVCLFGFGLWSFARSGWFEEGVEGSFGHDLEWWEFCALRVAWFNPRFKCYEVMSFPFCEPDLHFPIRLKMIFNAGVV